MRKRKEEEINIERIRLTTKVGRGRYSLSCMQWFRGKERTEEKKSPFLLLRSVFFFFYNWPGQSTMNCLFFFFSLSRLLFFFFCSLVYTQANNDHYNARFEMTRYKAMPFTSMEHSRCSTYVYNNTNDNDRFLMNNEKIFFTKFILNQNTFSLIIRITGS